MNEIPYGYCHCGCGKKTKIASRNTTSRGYTKGQPLAYVAGHRAPQLRETIPMAERFWSKVNKSNGDQGCWVWTTYLNAGGYGTFSIGGKHKLAHRVAWELTHGSIPDGLLVLHNCPDGDNPSCVNPLHLFLGTTLDNVKDRDAKGRQSKGESRSAMFSGELNPCHKLTSEQVSSIKYHLAQENESLKAIARKFGVTDSTVRMIRDGKRWASHAVRVIPVGEGQS